jgi:hypothetical protein
LIIASFYPVLIEGHEVFRVEGHKETEEYKEEVTEEVVWDAEEPSEEPGILEDTSCYLLNEDL